MFAQPRAVFAGSFGLAALVLFAGQAAGQSREELRERFREECRAQFPQLKGKAFAEERAAKVGPCVTAKFAAHTRGLAQRAAATPVTGRELKLLEYESWLTARARGPAEAKGAVYFVRGYPQPTDLDTYLAGPYLIKSLSDNGWDVISGKVPSGNTERGMLNVGEGAVFMRRRASELKAQGYKRVVLFGHSWSGWAAMLASGTDNFGADVLVLSAPATYGGQIGRLGGTNPIYSMNLTAFPAAVTVVKTPTVLILPDDREFDPDPVQRGAVAERHFAKANVDSLVLVKPPGFSGHFTAWLPVFDYAYGRCIEAFMASGVATRCNPPPLSNSDFRSIVELKQVTNPDDKRITAAEPLVGRKFVAYTLSPKVTHHYEYLSAAQRKHMQGIGLRNESIAFRNELHCVDGVCRKLIEWSNSEVLEFDDKSGKVVGWWVERR